TATTTYTFTPTSGQCGVTPATMTIVVNPLIATFDTVAPICSGDVLADLPTTSTNGITGVWSPAMDNTATTTYTFTPTSGQCGVTPATMTIVVNPLIATFDPVAPICSGDVLADLPTTSTNGITGVWSPAMDNTATTTYTFTPTSGQCAATPVTMTVVVNPLIATFDTVAPICNGDVLADLPTTSTNGITGVWSPVMDNTATTTYTFTPTSGQCAVTPVTMTIVVNPLFATFNPVAPICSGDVLADLPTTSTNGITGVWSPAMDNTATTTYTFIPTSGQCAVTPVTMTIIVNQKNIPTFEPITPFCENEIAPVLSGISLNSITGIWTPDTVSNTASGTYTFTPDSGQCASTIQITITVNPLVAAFNPVGPICNGDVLSPLPTTSSNGITGVWSPALDNTTTTTYTFTPTSGQCATASSELTITVNQNITPIFTEIAPICSGSTSPILPTTSNNAITGTWNPATVSNTVSGTYTFTPSVGQCSPSTSLDITVYQSPTDIIFTASDVVNDSPDGIIEITGTTSGLSPFLYSINNSSFTSNTSYTNLAPGNYTITVKDSNGCEFNKVATVSSICMFPNAISPGSDNYNDTFNLSGCNVVKLKIFNRYGREINNYTNYSNQWDGTNSKGESLPDGTYFYVAEFGDGTSKSGWVYVAR
ncbi:MAG: gliding motility-associated C-terminal domain-containing protein, partial [Flavobacterium sp.]|uniref:gliding motility-associated C-terminal domain-containing protein n=1 Tax=Flavobacterium sp. TaxID=239 RepID=UPI00260CD6FF